LAASIAEPVTAVDLFEENKLFHTIDAFNLELFKIDTTALKQQTITLKSMKK
jgi:hypothetical protein